MRCAYSLLAVVFLLFAISNYTIAQDSSLNKPNGIKIIVNKSRHSDQYFIDAINRANMESYRLRNDEVKITFKEGVECILLPANSIKLVTNISNYKEAFPENYKLPVFSVHPSGNLMAEYPKKRK